MQRIQEFSSRGHFHYDWSGSLVLVHLAIQVGDGDFARDCTPIALLYSSWPLLSSNLLVRWDMSIRLCLDRPSIPPLHGVEINYNSVLANVDVLAKSFRGIAMAHKLTLYLLRPDPVEFGAWEVRAEVGDRMSSVRRPRQSRAPRRAQW